VFQHAADIGASLAGDVIQFAAAVTAFMMASAPAATSTLRAPWRLTQDYRRGSRALTSPEGFDHHGGTVANQRPGHRDDVFVSLGAEVKDSGDAVRVRGFDDLARHGDFNAASIPIGMRSIYSTSSTIGRVFKAVIDQHAIVALQNDAGNLIPDALRR
jgi:hypothetical protein